MRITFHQAKRDATREARGLDFADAAIVFAGPILTMRDDRKDYGEERLQTYGLLNDRLTIIVWTLRDEARHVISMRYCNDREREFFSHQLR